MTSIWARDGGREGERSRGSAEKNQLAEEKRRFQSPQTLDGGARDRKERHSAEEGEAKDPSIGDGDLR